MQYNDDFIKKWEDILNEVNTTDIPLECIKKVVIKFKTRGQKTINLSTLRKQGLDWEEIEKVVNHNVRLKQEMGVDNGIYWKSSRENLIKISERLVRVSKQLKELGS